MNEKQGTSIAVSATDNIFSEAVAIKERVFDISNQLNSIANTMFGAVPEESVTPSSLDSDAKIDLIKAAQTDTHAIISSINETISRLKQL